MSRDTIDLDNVLPGDLIRGTLARMFSYDDSLLPTYAEYERVCAEDCADDFWGGSLYGLVSLSEYEAIYYDACTILVERAIDGREILPPVLATFTLDVLRGKRRRPSKRGPNRSKNYIRNFKIRIMLDVVAEHYPDFPIYDAYDNGRENACTIISECLQKCGHYLSPDAVKKIWEREGPPPIPQERNRTA